MSVMALVDQNTSSPTVCVSLCVYVFTSVHVCVCVICISWLCSDWQTGNAEPSGAFFY